MSLLKKLAGETAIYGLSSIVGRMLNFLLTFIYTRTLTKADNGVLNELYAYVGFLIVVYTYRMESAYFRYGTQPADRERAYSTGLISLVGSTVLITIGILLFSQQRTIRCITTIAPVSPVFTSSYGTDCLSEYLLRV